MRQRDVRTSAARPLRVRLPHVAPGAGGDRRAVAPATATTMTAAALVGGCSGACAVVRRVASGVHCSAPCEWCGVCGSAPPGVAASAVTAAGVGAWGFSGVPCATAHRTSIRNRAAWISELSRRAHGKPVRVPSMGTAVRGWGSTGPPCRRRLSGGEESAGKGGERTPGPDESFPLPVRHGRRVWWNGRVGGSRGLLDPLHHGRSHGHRGRLTEIDARTTRPGVSTRGNARFANGDRKAGRCPRGRLLRLPRSAVLARVLEVVVHVTVRHHREKRAPHPGDAVPCLDRASQGDHGTGRQVSLGALNSGPVREEEAEQQDGEGQHAHRPRVKASPRGAPG